MVLFSNGYKLSNREYGTEGIVILSAVHDTVASPRTQSQAGSLHRLRLHHRQTSMALVPFTYANPFTDQLRLPERLFTIDGRLIKIKQVGFGSFDQGTQQQRTERSCTVEISTVEDVISRRLQRSTYPRRGSWDDLICCNAFSWKIA